MKKRKRRYTKRDKTFWLRKTGSGVRIHIPKVDPNNPPPSTVKITLDKETYEQVVQFAEASGSCTHEVIMAGIHLLRAELKKQITGICYTPPRGSFL